MLSAPVQHNRTGEQSSGLGLVSRSNLRALRIPWTVPGEPAHLANGLEALGLADAEQLRQAAGRAETARERPQRELDLLGAEQRNLARRAASLDWANGLLAATNANLSTRLEAIERSTTWRIAAPL